MSSFHNFNIIPESGTLITRESLMSFVESLMNNGIITSDFQVFSGNSESLKNISLWDFQNKTDYCDELNDNSSLQEIHVSSLSELEENKDYSILIRLSNQSEEMQKLEVFQGSLESYPLFIIKTNQPFDHSSCRVNEVDETFVEINVNGINSFIKSSGRGTETLYGLGEKTEQFPKFYSCINSLYPSYEIGYWFE